ncbi:MAG TPA: hypothetical protein VK468_05520 [Pyrinomonadaceae bacterium]|nr:hypothetical protein [Pyrinomonadaceae bacterium]
MDDKGVLPPELKTVLMREGTFRGMASLLRDQKISEAQASQVLAKSYAVLLLELDEAKKEIKHIHDAVSRLEHTCRAGSQSRNAQAADSNHHHLSNGVIAFDGWVVSLMETDLTITGMLNPEFTRRKISEFGTAMNALMDKRASAGHPVLDDPSLFKGYVTF